MGITVAAFSAIHSRPELEERALNSLASSLIKDPPTFPGGILKLFDFQCTTSVYVALSEWIKLSEL